MGNLCSSRGRGLSCGTPHVSRPACMDREPRIERLRFEEFEHQSSQNGRARVRVVLARGKNQFTGEATGVETREGAGRTAALAALSAAQAATENRFTAELMGIKLVRAFDSWIVITALRARSSDRDYRLLGSSEAPGDDTTRGAVLSILDAINRVVGKYFDARKATSGSGQLIDRRGK